jgi:hypothetical protein
MALTIGVRFPSRPCGHPREAAPPAAFPLGPFVLVFPDGRDPVYTLSRSTLSWCRLLSWTLLQHLLRSGCLTVENSLCYPLVTQKHDTSL